MAQDRHAHQEAEAEEEPRRGLCRVRLLQGPHPRQSAELGKVLLLPPREKYRRASAWVLRAWSASSTV